LHTIKQTHEFVVWLTGLRELKTRQRLAMRLRKASLGNVKALGDGVHDRREHFGPSWRMYFVIRGDVLIVMLAGGDKASQSADISRAIRLAAQLEWSET
jgi:putative addiction module killer protein